jgi:hypothetical protein
LTLAREFDQTGNAAVHLTDEPLKLLLGSSSSMPPKMGYDSVKWHRSIILNKLTVRAKNQRAWDGKVYNGKAP